MAEYLRYMNSHNHTHIKGKYNVHPCTGTEALYRPTGGVEVQPYSFLTTALEGVRGSASRPGRSLSPGKNRCPLYRKLGGPKDRSRQVRKISLHRDSISGPSSPQPVAIPTELPGPKSCTYDSNIKNFSLTSPYSLLVLTK